MIQWHNGQFKFGDSCPSTLPMATCLCPSQWCDVEWNDVTWTCWPRCDVTGSTFATASDGHLYCCSHTQAVHGWLDRRPGWPRVQRDVAVLRRRRRRRCRLGSARNRRRSDTTTTRLNAGRSDSSNRSFTTSLLTSSTAGRSANRCDVTSSLYIHYVARVIILRFFLFLQLASFSFSFGCVC